MTSTNDAIIKDIEENYHKPHTCPVCGKYVFERHNSMDCCDICGWCDDVIQEKYPEYIGGANKMSLNEAKQVYINGTPIK